MSSWASKLRSFSLGIALRAALAVSRAGMHGRGANLKYMLVFAEAWQEGAIGQQAVGQLLWGHNIVLLTKLKDCALRLAYAEAAVEFGWSRSPTATPSMRWQKWLSGGAYAA